MLTLRELASALGGIVTGRQVLAPGPGHKSPNDHSMSVWIDDTAPSGFRSWSHSGDSWQVCNDHIREHIGLGPWRPGPRPIPVPRPPRPANHDNARRNLDLAQRLWRESVPAAGTLVETYLAARRLMLLPAVQRSGVLRFHGLCPFGKRGDAFYLPAMLARMSDPVTGQPCGVHRTALELNGSRKFELPGHEKAKMMLGPAGVIRLIHDSEIGHGLGIAEGIENAISVMMLGWSPVWSCGTAGGIGNFPVLPNISLTIFGDPGQAGENAAQTCADRWRRAGQEAVIRLPGDGDWNDSLKKETDHAA